MKEIPLLAAEDIDVRVSKITSKCVTLLLYKNARIDMKILDDVFGIFGWQRQHNVVNGNLFCTVSIWDNEKKVWIVKEDVGTESNTEKEKGQASDAFKRACVNVGIGRELYSAPFIFVDRDLLEIGKNANGKEQVKGSFSVKEIGYSNRNIDKLVIIYNYKGSSIVFSTERNIAKKEAPAGVPDNSKLINEANSLVATCAAAYNTKTESIYQSLKNNLKFEKKLCDLSEDELRTVIEFLNLKILQRK